MRIHVCASNTSYPLLLVFLIWVGASLPAFGQPVPYKAAQDRKYLYPWCSAIRCSDNAAPDMPLLSIKTGSAPEPGKTPDAVTAATTATGNNDESTAAADADTTDSKDGNTASPSAAAPPDQPATRLSATNNHDLSTAIIDEETDMLQSKYAGLISITPDEVSNIQLYRFIDQWYGVRYKWGGTDNTGIDCSGFAQKLYGSIYNLQLQRTARQQHRSCEIFKDYAGASEGDLVFFRVHHIGVSHVGVYLANGFFVHASRSRGVAISSLDEKYWRRRYAGCGKVEKTENTGTESGL